MFRFHTFEQLSIQIKEYEAMIRLTEALLIVDWRKSKWICRRYLIFTLHYLKCGFNNWLLASFSPFDKLFTLVFEQLLAEIAISNCDYSAQSEHWFSSYVIVCWKFKSNSCFHANSNHCRAVVIIKNKTRLYGNGSLFRKISGVDQTTWSWRCSPTATVTVIVSRHPEITALRPL
jgi:hypothetical protein